MYEDFLQKTHWWSSTSSRKFDDLMTGDHKVLDEESESRINHRYDVVVQDLPSQCIQSNPCETKTSQETEKSFKSSSNRHRSQRLTAPTTPLNLENPAKNYHGITERLFLIIRDNGLADRAVRRVKEGTLAVLLQSGLDETCRPDSMERNCFLRNVGDLFSDGENSPRTAFGRTSQLANDTTRDENLISSDIRQRSREVPSILGRSSSQASLTMHWNSANLVKIYGGISVLQRFIALSLVVLQKGQYAGWTKEHPRYCCKLVWMKHGGWIPWNVTVICATFKT